MTPKTDEEVIQDNTISLLKSMGYIFIPRRENLNLRNGKTFKWLVSLESRKLLSRGYC